jgi:hypothetical protein
MADTKRFVRPLHRFIYSGGRYEATRVDAEPLDYETR